MLTVGSVLKHEIENYADRIMTAGAPFVAARSGTLTVLHVKTYVSGILVLIRGTLGVLARAERRAMGIGDSALAAHYRHKLGEERGHDRWAERDLEGMSAAGIQHGSGGTAALHQLVAYLDGVVYRDPCLFLSYILLAEYLTVLVGPAWLQLVECNCGVPRSKMSVVAHHVELDREHVSEGIREIDGLVAPDKTAAMVEVLRASIRYYEQFWDEILSETTKAA